MSKYGWPWHRNMGVFFGRLSTCGHRGTCAGDHCDHCEIWDKEHEEKVSKLELHERSRRDLDRSRR